jgi:ribosomal protein S18 acetylase RimI-like enzyme
VLSGISDRVIWLDCGVIVRAALPGELSLIGDLRVAAYEAGGFLSDHYTETLRVLGTDGTGEILAAVDGDAVLGTVTLQHWPNAGQVVRGAGEAEVRALAVAPQAQRRGVGRALLRAVTERAARAGVRHLALCTQPTMRAAQRLYDAEGFIRLPDRDWSPVPGFTLIAYGRVLQP